MFIYCLCGSTPMNPGVQINLYLNWILKKKRGWNIFDYNKLNHKRFTIVFVHQKKKMACLITPIEFLSIQPFMRPLFSGQQEMSNLDYYFQDDWKTDAQTNQSIWKLNNIFQCSKVSHIIKKGWNFRIKSFFGRVVFCFAILRAISAYVGENWLSQYSDPGEAWTRNPLISRQALVHWATAFPRRMTVEIISCRLKIDKWGFWTKCEASAHQGFFFKNN